MSSIVPDRLINRLPLRDKLMILRKKFLPLLSTEEDLAFPFGLTLLLLSTDLLFALTPFPFPGNLNWTRLCEGDVSWWSVEGE